MILPFDERNSEYGSTTYESDNEDKMKLFIDECENVKKEHAFMSGHQQNQRNRSRNRQRNSISSSLTAFAHGDFALWLLDLGTTSHFTPHFEDLINPIPCSIFIQVADGSHLEATNEGTVELHFTSDQGIQTILRLSRVLCIPNLQTRLFSIKSFARNGCDSIV